MEEKGKYSKLLDDGREYVRMRYDMLRLELLEKMTKIIAMILLIIVTLVLLLTAFVYFSFALAMWLGKLLSSIEIGFCIVGGIFLLILLCAFLCRKKLFINPLIKQLTTILFKEDSNNDTNA